MVKFVKEFLERSRASKLSRRQMEAKMEEFDIPQLGKVMLVTTQEEPERVQLTPLHLQGFEVVVFDQLLLPTILKRSFMMASCVLFSDGCEDGASAPAATGAW